jgi:hypothetical protein
MSAVKYFGNYYAVLTKNQKDKYDTIEKEYYKALAIEKVRYKEFDELHDKFKECELYKETEKYYKENVSNQVYLSKEYKDNHKVYIEMMNIAENSIIGLEASREILKHARWDTQRYHAQMQKFRSAVYLIVDLPEPKGIPTNDPEKQCSICCINIKDYAITCGHIFCIECINKMKCECPNCKKSFVKDKVIKLYL